MKKVLIIGAGPAGLTAGYELLDKADGFEVVILEESDRIGGISRTVNYKGNRMDMGGHRFFSKVPEVNDWWEKIAAHPGGAPHGRRAAAENLHDRRRRAGLCCGGTGCPGFSSTTGSSIIRFR